MSHFLHLSVIGKFCDIYYYSGLYVVIRVWVPVVAYQKEKVICNPRLQAAIGIEFLHVFL